MFKSTEKEMLSYLENKYRETFEIEKFEKGSSLFPELYGGEKMIVHLTKNNKIPFNVFKNINSKGYHDDYILSYFSYQYTEKHKQEIEKLDNREMAVSFSLGFSDRPQDPNLLNRSVDDFVNDPELKGSIFLYVALKSESDQFTEQDSAFLYSLYTYMKGKTDRRFRVSVGYIKYDRFDDAQELLRMAHAINFGWSPLGKGVILTKGFEWDDPIQGPSYFEDQRK